MSVREITNEERAEFWRIERRNEHLMAENRSAYRWSRWAQDVDSSEAYDNGDRAEDVEAGNANDSGNGFYTGDGS